MSSIRPLLTSCMCPVVLLAAPSFSQPVQMDSAAALQHSREAAKKLLTTMRILLSQQLAAGGAVRAIDVCADSAQVVGERLQEQLGVSIRRVSVKWRNPKNIPDAFESAELKKFAELKKAGKLSDTSEFYQVVTENDVRTFRYMRPIMIGDMCLSCHGGREKMRDLIYSSIQQRYPNDKAVDYKAGELRGAVSVKIPLDGQKR
ncbi:MAG: DUF3365 domain-containing protein [Bacteroidetes bacterium]|nr:DUF3365 domain-containing protein [Bacteroidota bacterium]MCW5894954.1 DUF3365 domain-containing protein [Bacteroidota bacterium]